MKLINLTFKLIKKNQQNLWTMILLFSLTSILIFLLGVNCLKTQGTIGAAKALETDNLVVLKPFEFIQPTATPLTEEVLNTGSIYHVKAQAQTLLVYDWLVIRHYQPKMAAGEWFTTQLESAYVPVVVPLSSPYRLGEVFNLEKVNQPGKVIGKIAPKAMLAFEGKNKAGSFSLDLFFLNEKKHRHVSDYVIMPNQANLNRLLNQDGSIKSNYELVELSSKEQLLPFAQSNKYYGKVFDLSYTKDLFIQQQGRILTQLGAALSVALCIYIVLIYLNYQDFLSHNQKRYTVYYLVGMQRRTRIMIAFIKLELLIMLSLCLTSLILVGFHLVLPLDQSYFKWFLISQLGLGKLVFLVWTASYLSREFKLGLSHGLKILQE